MIGDLKCDDTLEVNKQFMEKERGGGWELDGGVKGEPKKQVLRGDSKREAVSS